ncbi:MAG TPA: AAA family ATPase, partial [Acidobacteriaceae bacterium]|nr:AAA family ATPase [Acidobacteriaceae bacterium]
VSAFRKEHGLEGRRLPFVAIPSALNLLDADTDVEPLIVAIQAAAEQMDAPLRLIVIDTLSRAMAGGNENAPDDMGALVRSADRIREATGANLLFIHHSGKDVAKGARGHSILRAAVDTEIEISRDTDTKLATIRVTKQRELDTSGELHFGLKSVELGRNQRNKPVTSCIVQPVSTTEINKSKLNGKELAAYMALQDLIRGAGTEPPNTITFPAVKVVSTTEWREFLKDTRVTSQDNSDSERSQWARIWKSLTEEGVIGHYDGFVWLS